MLIFSLFSFQKLENWILAYDVRKRKSSDHLPEYAWLLLLILINLMSSFRRQWLVVAFWVSQSTLLNARDDSFQAYCEPRAFLHEPSMDSAMNYCNKIHSYFRDVLCMCLWTYLLLLELIVRRLPALDVEGGIGNALKVDWRGIRWSTMSVALPLLPSSSSSSPFTALWLRLIFPKLDVVLLLT